MFVTLASIELTMFRVQNQDEERKKGQANICSSTPVILSLVLPSLFEFIFLPFSSTDDCHTVIQSWRDGLQQNVRSCARSRRPGHA